MRQKKSRPKNDTKIIAGFIIVKFVNNTHLYLTLLPGKDKADGGYSFYGTYDLPKGHAKSGEGILSAALRETEEESGFNKQDLNLLSNDAISVHNNRKNKTGHFFLASLISNKNPTFKPNKESGMREHGGFKWVTYDKFIKKVGNYWFAPAIIEAEKILNSSSDNKNEQLIRDFISMVIL